VLQNIRRELAEQRFTTELSVDASCKLLADVGCDVTHINVDSDDGQPQGAGSADPSMLEVGIISQVSVVTFSGVVGKCYGLFSSEIT